MMCSIDAKIPRNKTTKKTHNNVRKYRSWGNQKKNKIFCCRCSAASIVYSLAFSYCVHFQKKFPNHSYLKQLETRRKLSQIEREMGFWVHLRNNLNPFFGLNEKKMKKREIKSVTCVWCLFAIVLKWFHFEAMLYCWEHLQQTTIQNFNNWCSFKDSLTNLICIFTFCSMLSQIEN